MSDKHYFLGIDLGTSAVKVALIDHRRQMLAFQTVGYDIDQPEFGWREIDPNIWFRCLSEGLKELFLQFDPALVDAVGVTEHDFVEPPLNRVRGISLEKLLRKAAALELTEDETATLASRLTALEAQLTAQPGMASRSVWTHCAYSSGV